MPNKRSNRRNRNKKDRFIKGIRTPADIEKVIKDLEKHNLRPELRKFIIYTCERQVYGPDKSDEYIVYCLSSYFILGLERYQFLVGPLNLIPIQRIQEGASKDFKITAGLKDNIFQLIKIKTENLLPPNKVVMLSIDESGLKPGLKYDRNLDLIVGFEDNGIVRSQAQARFVMNIWISCLGGTWMMPVAFIFTQSSATPEQIKELLFDSITKLESIGLDVVGVVTKMRANFYDLSRQLNISPTNQSFKVGSKNIIFLYDAPQLMNITRNILMKYKLKFDKFETSWMFITMFFIIECQSGNRKTKLTMDHLKPTKYEKAFPRYAIELMSNTVATEMFMQISNRNLSEAAEGTAKVLDLMDKLFDILNSNQEISMNQFNSSYKGTKHQVKFMLEMMHFFENLKVFHKDRECTEEVKFAKGWLVTIRGVMKLWDVIKTKNYPYLLTRNTNCEVMDKFMNVTRLSSLGTENCTPPEFFDWYRQFFISSYFASDNMPEVNHQILKFDQFLEKVFKRIPPTVQNIGGENGTANSPSHSSSHQCLTLIGTFNLENLFRIFHQ